MQPRNKLLQFAPTPILVRDIVGRDDFNRTLCELILAARGREVGEHRSNRGGWQSPTSFLETLPLDLQRGLVELVTGCIGDVLAPTGIDNRAYKYAVTGWANVAENGGFNVPHSHNNGVWSAVYYLSVDPNSGGELHLMDPRPAVTVLKNAVSPWGSDLVYKPRSSSIIVFPSWLVHFVTPYTGQSPRINLAFNCS